MSNSIIRLVLIQKILHNSTTTNKGLQLECGKPHSVTAPLAYAQNSELYSNPYISIG